MAFELWLAEPVKSDIVMGVIYLIDCSSQHAIHVNIVSP
jgi:hypothetical protein